MPPVKFKKLIDKFKKSPKGKIQKIKRLQNHKKKNKYHKVHNRSQNANVPNVGRPSPRKTPPAHSKSPYVRKLLRSIKRRRIYNQEPVPLERKAITAKNHDSIIDLDDSKEDSELTDKPIALDDDCVIVDSKNEIVDLDSEDDEKTSAINNKKVLFKDSCRNIDLLFAKESDNNVLYSSVAPFYQKPSLTEIVNDPDADVIIINDSVGKSNNSILCIDDCKPNEDYIKLSVNEKSSSKNLRRKLEPEDNVNCATTPKRPCRKDDSLFTLSEKRIQVQYNSNTYNPSAGIEKPIKKNRPIIIDGSNVAFAHSCSNGFSSEGVKYCIDYFDKKGHDVKAVIPMFRKNRDKSSNPELLDKLHKSGKIVFTPCKNLPGQYSSSYDDRFILQLAYECDAAIVSNDNYRDLINESPAFKKIIENRVIGYTWYNDIFILPKDPYGRWGPSLDEILTIK